MITIPLVSVIITTYNRATLLKETISSILSQTFSNTEVIIVSDASDDNTDEVVGLFTDKRISYIKLPVNSKLPAKTRNEGIKIAKGEYIAFCDDDDLWHPEKLQKQMAIINGYDLCFTKRAYIDQQGNRIGFRPVLIPKKIDLSTLLVTNFITLSSVLMKADVVRRFNGFNTNPAYRASEDYDFWARLLANKVSFILCPEELVFYRLHNANITSDSFTGAKRTFLINKHLFAKENIAISIKIKSTIINFMKLVIYYFKR